MMRYRVVLEHDPETRHYTAIVPGLPGLLVDAKSEREALRLAREGIAFYVEELTATRGTRKPAVRLRAKVVTVDV